MSLTFQKQLFDHALIAKQFNPHICAGLKAVPRRSDLAQLKIPASAGAGDGENQEMRMSKLIILNYS